jgi:mannose-6-phosphate isomerase class I
LLSAADQQIALPRGASVLLPAALGTFTLHGTATLLRAYVPDPMQSATEL